VTLPLDVIGSLRFGVVLMVLLLIYCWIGSAGTAPLARWFPRTSVERTEMEWFTWWPFRLLLSIFIVSLVTASIRQVRRDLPRLGVWIVHAGVLVLITGSAIYFTSKVEGDMLVFRRQAVLGVPGGKEATLTVQPGARTYVYGRDTLYDVRVETVNPDYELLTGDDRGKRAFAVQLSVRPSVRGVPRAPFVRQLLAGYPQYTEDVLPGEGRAVKVTGAALVDTELTADLRYAPEDRIHLRDRFALHVRTTGEDDWAVLPLRGLPRYRERVGSTDAAWTQPGDRALVAGEWSLEPRPTSDSGPLGGVSIRVTGFLPYARLEERLESGGSVPTPLLRFTARTPRGTVTEQIAGGGGVSQFGLGDTLISASFAWEPASDRLDRWPQEGPPRLAVRVSGSPDEQEFPLTALQQGETRVAGGRYGLELVQFYPDWTLASTKEKGAMALVRIRGPERTFTRSVVFPHAEFSQDLDESGQRGRLIDESISIELRGLEQAGLLFRAGPGGVRIGLAKPGGGLETKDASLHQQVSFDGGLLGITVDEVSATSQRVVKPFVIPRAERDSKAGSSYSLVQVEVARGGERKTIWLRYSHYAHSSRYGFFPQKVSLPGGRPVEIVYSRETRRLPEAVALETFRLETYPGQMRERDYVSLVRFFDDGRWSDVREIRSNHPSDHRGWWYFQATWDPPSPQTQYAGLNHTGLGVGNRHGVGLMMLGALLTIAGTAWSFYVKPIILSRRGRLAARLPEGTQQAPRASVADAAPALRIALFLLLGTIAFAGSASARDEGMVPPSVPASFVEALDLKALRLSAVQDEGRVKTLDSMAHEKMKRVNASAGFRRVDATVRYLDMMLAPEHYGDAGLIYIRKSAVRRQIAQEIRNREAAGRRGVMLSDAALDRVIETGLVSPAFLDDPVVQDVLADLERDLMRTNKDVQALRTARAFADGHALHGMWRGVPPPGGDDLAPWLSVAAFASTRSDSGRAMLFGVPGGVQPSLASSIGAAWGQLRAGWRAHDAAAVNGAAGDLARLMPRAEPRLYPSEGRRRAELWYYRSGKLTAGWIVYFLALPFLLMSVVYRLRWARRTGLLLFALGFGLHTLSIVLRWMLAGRIPNSNMFEAIVASSWLGGAVAIVLEALLRRRPARSLPALAASAYAMTAMMVGHFMPVALNSDIMTVMPILDRTIWLYIHTNMVIASYALIFFGAVTAVLYLGGRAANGLVPSSAFAVAWSGHPSLEEDGLSRALDGATMIFLQLAFLMLWTGTILGAVWANVSWGRPWGWDPKEVFALNTWIVFLVLVHIRLKVRDKALWTAILAVIGCAVMLFNWIAVNFIIVGLHSYA
jgi:cytochrome c-type biogenesis protein CcsB